MNLRAVFLVEGVSDRLALETLASRRRIALPAHGISVVSMDGAGNIGRYLERFGPHGSGLTISGL
jgi:predicted ATP-dependent endonuclease of OLD family